MYSPGRRLVALYLAAQGLVGAAWWVALALHPPFRQGFRAHGLEADLILAFAPADLLLYVLASLLGAMLFAIDHTLARPVLWMVVGATAYAALLCLGLALRGPGFWAPTVLMVIAAACTLALGATVRADEPALPRVPFATARRDAAVPASARTLLQIVVFWTFFLAVVPLTIRWCERGVGVTPLRPAPLVGAIVFGAGGSLGLWAAHAMAFRGGGTPLPTDSPPRLVTRGPYSRLRNPMAVGGLVQGAAVALWIGSWGTLLYAILGGLVWQCCIRPAEEADLEGRLGDAYREYRRHVRCWLPSLSRYSPRG